MQSQISNPKSQFLNIICFDVPFPADYGGAIEEFYKLKALHELGIKIYLHCFVYGDRKEQEEIEKYCEKVYYYERKRSLKYMFSNFPFIVKSRMQEKLLHNLADNNFPILFDGTHSTGFLNHPTLKERKKVVRLHNIEWIYYSILFHSSFTAKEKLFYFLEYKKLRKYDKYLANADALSCLSQTDFEYYEDKFPDKTSLEFVFHENETVSCKGGKGNYILYHGNLSLLDNYQIILDLLQNELKDCKHRIIISGKNPDKSLTDFVKDKTNVQLISNPTNQVLNELMENAHICLAMAKNPSGVKLKLINSLFKTRFVISNEYALNGSNLDTLCIVPELAEFATVVDNIMEQLFTEEDITTRKTVLSEKYNNLKNAQQLINLIFTP